MLATFKCDKCARTFRYGIEEGEGVKCECLKGKLTRSFKMLEKLLSILTALVAAINANTVALGGAEASDAGSSAPKTKKKTAVKKTTKKKSTKKAATKDSVKSKAKKIAVASENGKVCAGQIKELVSEVALECYNDASVTLADFDDEGVAILDKALDSFEYQEEIEDAPDADELDI